MRPAAAAVSFTIVETVATLLPILLFLVLIFAVAISGRDRSFYFNMLLTQKAMILILYGLFPSVFPCAYVGAVDAKLVLIPPCKSVMALENRLTMRLRGDSRYKRFKYRGLHFLDY